MYPDRAVNELPRALIGVRRLVIVRAGSAGRRAARLRGALLAAQEAQAVAQRVPRAPSERVAQQASQFSGIQ